MGLGFLTWACPVCAAGQDTGISKYILVAALIAVPYVVTSAIFVLIRRNLDS